MATGIINPKAREAVRARSGGLCQACGHEGNHAHHWAKSYRTYGWENDDGRDLTWLCVACHEMITARRRAGRRRDRGAAQARQDEAYWQAIAQSLAANQHYKILGTSGANIVFRLAHGHILLVNRAGLYGGDS